MVQNEMNIFAGSWKYNSAGKEKVTRTPWFNCEWTYQIALQGSVGGAKITFLFDFGEL